MPRLTSPTDAPATTGPPGDPDALHALGELTAACAEAGDPGALLDAAVPLVRRLAGAAAALVVVPRADGAATTVHDGVPLDPAALEEHRHSGEAVHAAEVPLSWGEQGVTSVVCQPLAGLWGRLVVAWTGGARPGQAYEVGVSLLLHALAARDTEERLADLQARVDNAQQLASMGDYDWHIASDTNRWSDQLYRIYGHEPQSFNASYERFLSFIHPDDRELVQQVHRTAYQSGEPYQMVERIVRPDGELRYLASNGQVIQDEDGTPLRFRGTCIDITPQVRAEQERERTRRVFESLVESSPDAIVVLEPGGAVARANGRAADLLGGDPVGRRLEELFPNGLPGGSEPEGLGVEATALDGRDLMLDLTSARLLEQDGDAARRSADDAGAGEAGAGLVAVFLRDAEPRLDGEATAATLREAQLRRRQALEINDNVVQGLSAALYALEAGDEGASAGLQRRTLASARQMMSDLLDPLDGTDLQPGDLVRSAASSAATSGAPGHELGSPSAQAAPDEQVAPQPVAPARVLLVDDSEDIRFLLRVRLSAAPDVTLVGEAADGEEAIRKAEELRPDLVLLDLAMPRMDGLEALPRIRAAVPDARVVVLSGFEDGVMAQRAVAAGADHYVEKGTAMDRLVDVVAEVLAEG